MATIVEYHEEQSAVSFHAEEDGELWMAPAFTADGDGYLFLTVSDLEYEVESGLFLGPEAVKLVIKYLEGHLLRVAVAEAEAVEDGE